MKCKKCGFEMPGGSAVCPECGASQSDAPMVETQENGEKGEAPTIPVDAEACSDSETSQTTIADDAPSKKAATSSTQSSPAGRSKSKKAVAIGVIAVVAVAAIGAIAFFALSSGNVPEETVKRAVQSTEFAQKGVVSPGYVNESPYQITEFKIDSQKDEKGFGDLGATLVQGVYGTETVRHVMFSGKIANESFETSFAGDVYCVKQGSEWKEMAKPSMRTTGSVPLKGVDRITKSADDKTPPNGFASSPLTYDGFTSTFDSADGAYSSQATVTAACTFWFATDTAQNSLVFDFKGESGWVPRGEVQVSDTKTNWTLSGKTFEGSAKVSNGIGNASLSFEEPTGDVLSATYSVAYAPDPDAPAATVLGPIHYNSVDLSGNVQGKPLHEFGRPSFSADLNDGEQSVTFSCSASNGSSALVAGQGNVNSFYTDVVTNSVIRVMGPTETTLKLSSLTLAQNV